MNNKLLQEAINKWPNKKRQRGFGVRIKFRGNVLYCDQYRTTHQNYDTVWEALCLLLGYDPRIDGVFEDFKGKVDVYISKGANA